jgi:hypothetical protein
VSGAPRFEAALSASAGAALRGAASSRASAAGAL